MTRKEPTEERPVQAGRKIVQQRQVADGILRVPVPRDPEKVAHWLRELDLWARAQPFYKTDRGCFPNLRAAHKMAQRALNSMSEDKTGDAVWAAMQVVYQMFLAMLTDSRDMIDIGVDIYRRNERRNLKASQDAEQEALEWQAEAEGIWRKNLRMSALAVAKRIDPLRAETIRKKIKKPPA